MTFRLILERLSDRSWTRPPLIRIGDSVGLGMASCDGEAYHANRRMERNTMVQAIDGIIPLRGARVCSIGSGYGGEEMLMEEAGASVDLIEPARPEFTFLERKFAGRDRVRLHRSFFQFCTFSEPFDLIYGSSLGSWMNSEPLAGIDEDLLSFCSANLSPRGFAIFLVYGGLHSTYVLDKHPFLASLIASAKKSGLMVNKFARYRKGNALLVVSHGPRFDLSALTAFAGDELLSNGVIVKASPVRALDYVSAFAIALYTMAKNIGTSFRDFYYSIAGLSRYNKH